MANEKHSKNITLRGNVAKSTVIFSFYHSDFYYSKLIILMNLKSFCCCSTVKVYFVYCTGYWFSHVEEL